MTFTLHLENVVTTWTLLKEVSWHVTVILIYIIYIGLRQSEDKWTMLIFMSLLSSDFFQHVSKYTVKWYKSNKIFFMWWQADFFHQSEKCTPPPLCHSPHLFWRHCTGRLLDNTHMCYEYTTPFSLANSDNTDKMNWVWPCTLQSVNRWRHYEYSCCLHPSCSYNFKAHLLSRSDQWSDCQTWCDKLGYMNMNGFVYLRKYGIATSQHKKIRVTCIKENRIWLYFPCLYWWLCWRSIKYCKSCEM